MDIEKIMCSLFDEDSTDIEVVKNEAGEIVKVVGDNFEYVRQRLIYSDS